MLKLIGCLSATLVLCTSAIAERASGQEATDRRPMLVIAQAAPMQSAPVANSGWDCSRCTPGATYCVINFVRFEYACAPMTTYACAGFSGTTSCSFGTICWDGNCRLSLW